MTKFSQTLELNTAGIVGSGHPPVLHSWIIPADLPVLAGQVLIKTAGVVSVWDGSTTSEPPAEGETVTPSILAIAISEPMAGDTSMPVLAHGCYLFSRATISGGAPLTTEQAEYLSSCGLFAENTW